MKKRIVKYFVGIYLISVILMTLVRVILFWTMTSQPVAEEDMHLVWKIFRVGWAFDSLITCYVLMLPIVFLLFYSFFSKKYPHKLWRNINRFLMVFFVPIFALLFMNIPTFKYNNSPLSLSDFEYLKYFKTTIGMVVGESSYWLYFGLFFLFVFGLYFLIRFVARRTVLATEKQDYYKLPFMLLFLCLGLFCFVGMRGSLKRYPLRVSNASFCNNSLFNKMALNPVFYLIKSYEKQKKGFYALGKIVDVDDAYQVVQKELGITSKNPKEMEREVTFEQEGQKLNVVIILAESLSMDYFKWKRKDGTSLMPFVEKLMKESYFFDNFYSAGNHTNNGILATLYGFPTIFNRPSLQNKENLYKGLPFNLKQNGYSNYFFLTGNPNYDNMSGFLYNCGFIDKIYSLEDYPKEKEVNNFGVSDEFLFEFGLKELNKIAKKKEPFFATFLTISNHPPYVIPDKYKNNDETDQKRIMMFVDDNFKVFFRQAMQQDWAKNTLFVFLGDHGKVLKESRLPMALDYNHIPMLIYSEKIKNEPKVCSQFGGQIDVFPTIMGLLQLPYTNNSFGIDLFRAKRNDMFFVSNTHMGCINNEFFYTYDVDNKMQGLFRYRTSDTENKITEYPKEAERMKRYGFAMQKVAEEEILK